MPVVLLVVAVLLSFVLVLPLVADCPVTLLVSPAADATPVASARAGTNNPASSLDLNVFIVCLLCGAALIVALDGRNLRLHMIVRRMASHRHREADETRVGHRARWAP